MHVSKERARKWKWKSLRQKRNNRGRKVAHIIKRTKRNQKEKRKKKKLKTEKGRKKKWPEEGCKWK